MTQTSPQHYDNLMTEKVGVAILLSLEMQSCAEEWEEEIDK